MSAKSEVQGCRSVVVWLDMETAQEFVPREVAERLAEALAVFSYPRGCEGSVPYCKRGEETCRWCAARDALAEYRAVFPKADAVTRVVESAGVTTRQADRLSKAEEA